VSTFRGSRDLLLRHREDYDRAYAEFRWPELGEFNWALDWFDRIGTEATALWVVEEGGAEQKLSFTELSERSSRVANHLRSLGVSRGDRLILMLGNRIELWETLLASMKLGAVVIPATTLLGPADGAEADEGELALPLAARPLGLMGGYLDDEELTAQAMREGYYHTGDVASRDADGYITYVGRADDVFKASDYRISPFELESVLIEHEAVAEAAVVPSPDPLRLAVPKAYIALAAGHEPTRETALSILVYARHQLAPYKRIRRLEFAELPKTISGKIRRVDLRTHAARAGDGEFRDEDFPELKQQPAASPSS
jgi:acyl-coenzyme A synthetase/AMP-(fatty) acid ligase